MKTRKGWLPILVAVSLGLVLVWSACAPTPTPPTPTPAAPKPTPTPAAPKPTPTPAAPTPAKVYTLSLATAVGPGTSVYEGVQYFFREVEKRTNGRVKFKPYWSGTLYSELKAVEATIIGAVDMSTTVPTKIRGFTDVTAWTDLPYIAEKPDGFLRVFNDPVEGKNIRERTRKEVGVVHIGYFPSNGGPAPIANTKRELRVPDDAKGLKFRAAEGADVEVAMAKALGGFAVTIPWAEATSSLQAGVYDAGWLPYVWYVVTGQLDIYKYVTDFRWLFKGHTLLMNPKVWDSLPEDIRQIMEVVAREAEKYELEVDRLSIEKSRLTMAEHGVKIYEPKGAELELWKAVAEKVALQFTTPEKLARIKGLMK